MNAVTFFRVMNSMRWPLIYVVVMAHVIPFTLQQVTFLDNSNELYAFNSELFSHHIAKLSLRCLFFVFGYYSFQKCTNSLYQFAISRWKNRFSMLLIAYFTSIILLLMIIVVKKILFEFLEPTRYVEYLHVSSSAMLPMSWTTYINLPLWYVLDLLYLFALFPILFYFIKLTKYYGILLLGAMYLMNVESDILGLRNTTIFFFSAGAYFSIHKKDMLKVFEEVRVIALLLTIAFLTLTILTYGLPNHECFLRVFLIAGVVSSINLFAYLKERNNLRKNLLGFCLLASFIYVAYETYMINFFKGFCYDLEIYENGWIKIACYIIIPLLYIGICMVIVCVFQKFIQHMNTIIVRRKLSKQSRIQEQVHEKINARVATV